MDEKITRDNVLGLDIAEKCGYHCTGESGTWNFHESKRRNDNKMHKAFRETLIDCIQRNNIKKIVAEDVSVNTHFRSVRVLSELRGIMLEVCDTLNLPEPAFVNPSSIKHFATGDGKADKEKMVKYCIKRWGITPVDDNEADATHVYFYYIKHFRM